MSECSFGPGCLDDHIQDSRGRCFSKSSPAGRILLRAQNRLQPEMTGGSDLSSEVFLLQKNVKQLMDALQNERNLNKIDDIKKLQTQFAEIEKLKNEVLKHSEKVENVSKSNQELAGIDARIKSDVQMLKEARTEIAKLLLETKRTLEQVNATQAESQKDIVLTNKNIEDAQKLQKSLHQALEQFHSKHAELKTASIELEHRVNTQIDEIAKLKASAIETFASVAEQVFSKMQTLEQSMKMKLNDFIVKAEDDASRKINSFTKSAVLHVEDETSNVMKEAKQQIHRDVEHELEDIKREANASLQNAVDLAKTSSIEARTLLQTVNTAEKTLQNEVLDFKANAEKVKLAIKEGIKSINQETLNANMLGEGIAALTNSLTNNIASTTSLTNSVGIIQPQVSPQKIQSVPQYSLNNEITSSAESELNDIIKEFNRAQKRVEKDKEQYEEIQEKINNDHKVAENYLQAISIKQQNSSVLKAQYAQVAQALDRVEQAATRTPKNQTVQYQLEKAIEARELLDSSIKQIEMDIANLTAKYNAALALVETEVENAKMFRKQAEDRITKVLSLNDQIIRGKSAIEIAKAAKLNGGSISEDMRFEIELEAGQNLIKAGHLNTSIYYKNKMNSLRAHLDGGGSLDNLELL